MEKNSDDGDNPCTPRTTGRNERNDAPKLDDKDDNLSDDNGCNNYDSISGMEKLRKQLLFSYLWLEFNDPVVQRDYEQFLAVETSWLVSFVSFIVPLGIAVVYFWISDVIYLSDHPPDVFSIFKVVVGAVLCMSHLASSFFYMQSVHLKNKAVRSAVIDFSPSDAIGDEDDELEMYVHGHGRVGAGATVVFVSQNKRTNDDIEYCAFSRNFMTCPVRRSRS